MKFLLESIGVIFLIAVLGTNAMVLFALGIDYHNTPLIILGVLQEVTLIALLVILWVVLYLKSD